MLKKFNVQGFTLIEVSIALLILFIALSIFIPIGIRLYLERLAIREHYQALEYINEWLLLWRFDHMLPLASEIFINDTNYYLVATSPNDSELTLCLEWIGRNARNYEQCGFAKK